MIDMVKKFFGKNEPDGSSQADTENSHDIRVAACAILLEMGKIDGEFDPKEQEDIVSLLKRDFGLSDEHAAELMGASQKELDGSIDLWSFTHLINENYSTEEKIRVMEMLWAVVYADGVLDQHEDYLVHKLAKLLRISHKEMINAKLKILGKDKTGK